VSRPGWGRNRVGEYGETTMFLECNSSAKTCRVAPSQRVGTCCRKLLDALTVDPYLDPEHANLYVLGGRLYICVYDEQGERIDEPVNYCPWCGSEAAHPLDHISHH
jgi:hypothetical protein